MQAPESVRLDKWLWAVRLYKTRTLAAAACNAGQVQIAGSNVKPARNVHPGEEITAVCGDLTKRVKVLALLESRVGAKLVPNFLEDLTPASEYEKIREKRLNPVGIRPPGSGRPTKKDRRKIIKFLT